MLYKQKFDREALKSILQAAQPCSGLLPTEGNHHATKYDAFGIRLTACYGVLTGP